MEMIEQATRLFMQSAGGDASLDSGRVKGALQELLGGTGDELNIAGLVGKLKGNGLASLAQSWLGNGANEAISGGQVSAMLGDADVSSFAARLGLEREQASAGLAGMLPRLIDENSRDGNLPGGGAGGFLKMARQFLGR